MNRILALLLLTVLALAARPAAAQGVPGSPLAIAHGVPREGAKATAEGRFESVFSVLGRTMAAIVQSP